MATIVRFALRRFAVPPTDRHHFVRCSQLRVAAAWLPAVVMLALSTACTDEHRTKSQPAMNAHGMTQQQRLQDMNRLGEDADPDRRWRYSLPSACELDVKLTGDKRAAHRVRLSSAIVGQSFNRGSSTYSVTVIPMDPAASAIQVFESPRWTHSVEMFSHIRLQQRDCVQPLGTPPPK
jgi:hypothetical protein